MLELMEKIEKYKVIRDENKNNDVLYSQYNNLIADLERAMRPAVRLHVEGAPACEGCQ